MTHLLSLLSIAPQQGPTNVPKLPDSPYFWLPVQGSTAAGSYDDLFDFIMWVSVVSCLVLIGLMVWFVLKFKAKSRSEKPEPSTDHNTFLELVWSIVPLPIVLAMFVWGFQGFVAFRTTPKDAYQINVTAQKWKWLFEYPAANGYTDDVLHVPKGQKIRVVINALDVLHSFYLPAFRTKIDAVPGRYTELWFEPIKTGEFPIFCAEYCGTGHSEMMTKVVVHEQADFDQWLKDVEKILDEMPPQQLGEKMYNMMGCSACHSLDGTIKTGPSFKGVFGKTETLEDGSSVKVDENYIKQSLMEPQSQIVKGFPPAMPTFKGKLSDKKISGIIAFIQSQQK